MTGEEELGRQAIAQIRGWLEREREARGNHFIPRLAVKFCGGCNPIIERGILAQAIQEGLTGMVHWVPSEEKPDLVLIINGCLTACANESEIRRKSPAALSIQGNSISGIERNPSPNDSGTLV